MAQQAKHGGTFVNDATVGTIDWTSPGNAISSNDVWASAALARGIISHYLKVTNFGFTIPDTATINWIKVTIERHASNVLVYDCSVKLVKGGTIQGDDKPTETGWSASDTNEDHGGTDKWGLTLLYSDINANDFGCAVSGKNYKTGAPATYTGYIDDIIITVDYTVVSNVYLAGIITGIATTLGFTNILHTLKGLLQGQAGVSGFAKILKTLQTTVSGSSTVSGFAKILKSLKTTVSGIASVIGLLTVTLSGAIQYLAGVIQGIASVSGFAKITHKLSATINGIASISGVIRLFKGLKATVNGMASISGITKVIHTLSSIVNGVASVSGTIKRTYRLAGQVIGTSVISGFVKITHTLQGLINGVAQVSGTLEISLMEVWLSAVIVGTSAVNGFLRNIKYVSYRLPVSRLNVQKLLVSGLKNSGGKHVRNL